MKIGIFGDSYGVDGLKTDVHNYGLDPKADDRVSWSYLLTKEYKVENFSRSGTSTWYSYEQFLEHRNKFDVIIFIYSAYSRWPVLPKKYNGLEYKVTLSEDQEMNDYVRYYMDLYSQNLLHFIVDNIFRSVNEICKNENRYLINVQTLTRSDKKYPTNFPNYYDLQEVAVNEKILLKNKLVKINEINKNGYVDERIGHLCNENHHLLYNLFKNNIKEKKYNISLSVYEDLPWVEINEGIIKTVYNKTFKDYIADWFSKLKTKESL